MRCARCDQDAVIRIEMRIGAEPVTFLRCSVCEVNVWEGTAGEVSLDEILELARVSR